MQEIRNTSALAMELRLSCINSSIYRMIDFDFALVKLGKSSER